MANGDGGATRARTDMPASIARAIEGYAWSRDAVGKSEGTVFRLRSASGLPDLFLKHGSGHAALDVADEAVRLGWLAGKLAAPKVHAVAGGPDAFWLLTAALPGRTAARALSEARDDAEADALLEAIAAFVRRLHALPVATCPFDAGQARRLADARERMAQGRVDADDFDPVRVGWKPEQVWLQLQALRPDTIEPVVAHGDLTLDNLLVHQGAVSGCIDVGRLGVADRYQDLALLWRSLGDAPRLQRRLFDALGIAQVDFDPRRLQFHLVLDEFF